MGNIIHKPIAGNPHKEGTTVIGAPRAGQWGTGNYVIDGSRITNLPTTGTINSNYSGRFDDTTYYTA